MIPGETIILVNRRPYDPDLLTQDIARAASSGPLALTVKRGSWQLATSIAWSGGLRNPHVERVAGSPAVLDEMPTTK